MFRSLAFCLLIFASSILVAQDTTYYDTEGVLMEVEEGSESYWITEPVENDTSISLVIRIYRTDSDQIKSERHYSEYSEDKKRLHGSSTMWYNDGSMRRKMSYNDGKLEGELETYWKNGALKRKDFYEADKLIEGKVWNDAGEEEEYYDYQILPEYEGGVPELIKYLSENIVYPKEAIEYSMEGVVYVKFTVEEDGAVTNAHIIRGVQDDIDKEALRVVNDMPNWKPGMQDGEVARIKFVLPVRFQLTE